MDTRHKQKRRNMKYDKRRDMNPQGAIQGIIDPEFSDDLEDQQFRRKKIDSNWSRYTEDTEEETGNEQLNAPDFELLASQPSSASGHFLFSSEKSWEEEEQALDKSSAESPNNYFTLNLNLLNAGLQTIPFYKRMDYDESMFSSFDIRLMNAEAEIAEAKYKKVVAEHEAALANPKIVSSRKSSGKPKSKASAPATPSPQPPAAQLDTKDDELDELLNMTTNQVAEIGIKEVPEEEKVEPKESVDTEKVTGDEKKASADNKEDIQQWLDDILDE